MFEVGFSELLVIFVLGLIVLGPQKLPQVAAQIGRWVGRARTLARQFRDQLEQETSVSFDSNAPPRPRAEPHATQPPPAAAPGPDAPSAPPSPQRADEASHERGS
ncbi:MAG: twin-arginine translocase subunit TatB [Gammaproteobacteria bacterium]|nr:twin-arginine translocase subunit TatB [Gammaproteobacteria bacterium]